MANRSARADDPSIGKLSLLFAAGARPRVEEIDRLAAGPLREGIGFTISHRPHPPEGWLELLAQGLTFDCAGLHPGEGFAPPPAGQFYGIDPQCADANLAAVTLTPGPHLAAGAHLQPVVRTTAALGARLAALPGVEAVCWHPAGTWIEPKYFARIVKEWLGGGAFPALGLTALHRRSDGVLASQGLGFLIGQEIELAVPAQVSPADAARLAVRLIDGLVESGAITEPTSLLGPHGERLDAEPNAASGIVRVQVSQR
jgi:hypothetical protein